MKITIKGEFTSLNQYINAERSNRHIAAKLKKSDMEAAQWQLKGFKAYDGNYPARISFTWYTKDERTDPDNSRFGCKAILDSMVKEGIIPNDSRKYIKGFTDDFETSKDVRVEIEITGD